MTATASAPACPQLIAPGIATIVQDNHIWLTRLVLFGSSRAAARGMTLTNQEELRGSSSASRGATSEIVGEHGNMNQRHNQIQVWSQRARQSYNSALQWWPTVSCRCLIQHGFQSAQHKQLFQFDCIT